MKAVENRAVLAGGMMAPEYTAPKTELLITRYLLEN